MLTLRGSTAYQISRLKSGYFVIRHPRGGEPEIIACKIATEADAIAIVDKDAESDYKTTKS